MERKDFAMLPFASWHIRDFALLTNTLIKILARGVGQNACQMPVGVLAPVPYQLFSLKFSTWSITCLKTSGLYCGG